MRSQMPRESQGPSVQIGSDFAQDQIGASGMPSSPIRGNYQGLNLIPGRGGETSASSASDSRYGLDHLRRLRAQGQAQQEDSADRAMERKIYECIRKGWKGEQFRKAGIPGTSFTEGHITRCIEKDWYGEDFPAAGIPGTSFTEGHITRCIEKEWYGEEFPAAGISGTRFTEEQITRCIEKEWGIKNFQEARIPGTSFTENHITLCIEKGWDKYDFGTVGISATQFTSNHVQYCLSHKWKGRKLRDIGIPAETFSEDNICDCFRKKWRSEDFRNVGIDGDQFTEKSIMVAIKCGWKGSSFGRVGISGTRFTGEHITRCIEKGWYGKDFQNAGIPGMSFTGKQITLCIDIGWQGKDFQNAGIPGTSFTGEQITLCIENGWRGIEFYFAGIPGTSFTEKQITLCIEKDWNGISFQSAGVPGTSFTGKQITLCIEKGWRIEDFRKAGIVASLISEHVTACIQKGWKEEHFAACGFTDDDFRGVSTFLLSYIYPKDKLKTRFHVTQDAEEYNEGYQELYKSRKKAESYIDWNIPEIEERIDSGNAEEKINELLKKLETQFGQLRQRGKFGKKATDTTSDSLYNYTMNVDPHEATLVYCIQEIVDRIGKNYLSNDNISEMLPKVITLYNNLRDYINEKDKGAKEVKKKSIIKECEDFLPLLKPGSGLYDIIAFVKELEETFDEDATLKLNASGNIGDYEKIDIENKDQYEELLKQNMFNQHAMMRKVLNDDKPPAGVVGGGYSSKDAYTHHSTFYNLWLQTFPDEKDVPYGKLRNIGLYQMSCMCSKTEKNIKVYRYIEYHRDPLLQICGYRAESPLKKKKKTGKSPLSKAELSFFNAEEMQLKNDTLARLDEAKKAGILLEDPAFMSTGFQPVPSYAHEVMMVICCPKGTPMYITNFENSYKEVVLPRHTRLKILDVEDAGGKSEYGEKCQIVLTVEVVGVGM